MSLIIIVVYSAYSYLICTAPYSYHVEGNFLGQGFHELAMWFEAGTKFKP